jgi:hypothetical protein
LVAAQTGTELIFSRNGVIERVHPPLTDTARTPPPPLVATDA